MTINSNYLKTYTKNKAFFIDRDGTINKYIPYIKDIDKFEIMENVSKAIKMINSSDWLAIVVTNQPQVAKGILSKNGVEDMHIKMNKLLDADGAKLDGIYYCPCLDCECRKPNQGMYKQAQKDFGIDFKKSVFIGDTTRDVAVTNNIGGKSILLNCGLGGKDNKYKVDPDYRCEDLYDAVKLILQK
jgi:HAD superfamily hydrolase (TIGR01662 family)